MPLVDDSDGTQGPAGGRAGYPCVKTHPVIRLIRPYVPFVMGGASLRTRSLRPGDMYQS